MAPPLVDSILIAAWTVTSGEGRVSPWVCLERGRGPGAMSRTARERDGRFSTTATRSHWVTSHDRFA